MGRSRLQNLVILSGAILGVMVVVFITAQGEPAQDLTSCAICWVPPLLIIGGVAGAAAAAGAAWGASAAEKDRRAREQREQHRNFDPTAPKPKPKQYAHFPDDGSPPLLVAEEEEEDSLWDWVKRDVPEDIKTALDEAPGVVDRVKDFIESDEYLGAREPEDD